MEYHGGFASWVTRVGIPLVLFQHESPMMQSLSGTCNMLVIVFQMIVSPSVQNNHSCNHSNNLAIKILVRLQERLLKMIIFVIV